jgi:hypothetical protein
MINGLIRQEDTRIYNLNINSKMSVDLKGEIDCNTVVEKNSSLLLLAMDRSPN